MIYLWCHDDVMYWLSSVILCVSMKCLFHCHPVMAVYSNVPHPLYWELRNCLLRYRKSKQCSVRALVTHVLSSSSSSSSSSFSSSSSLTPLPSLSQGIRALSSAAHGWHQECLDNKTRSPLTWKRWEGVWCHVIKNIMSCDHKHVVMWPQAYCHVTTCTSLWPWQLWLCLGIMCLKRLQDSLSVISPSVHMQQGKWVIQKYIG